MNFSTYRLIPVAALVAFAGCTRSIEVTYNDDITPVSAAAHAPTIGITKLVDMRSWVDPKDAKSLSFVAQQGTWKFGMTYEGKEFIPVNDFIQQVMVEDFGKQGWQSTAVDQTVTSDAAALAKVCKDSHTDYALGGKIETFEFVNETGFVTVTSRRAVSLVITVAKADGTAVLNQADFTQNDREGEGMGVLHSTNVDKLVNVAFKKVITDVLANVHQKTALDVREVRVQYANGDLIKRFQVGANDELIGANG
jgi:hypothetical protein